MFKNDDRINNNFLQYAIVKTVVGKVESFGLSCTYSSPNLYCIEMSIPFRHNM